MLDSVYVGDVIDFAAVLAPESAQCLITSPPYFNLRDYGTPPTRWPTCCYRPMPGLSEIAIAASDSALGQESTIEEYTAHLVMIFRALRPALAPDGVLWLNIGDSYAGGGAPPRNPKRWSKEGEVAAIRPHHAKAGTGIAAKNLLGVPWRVAFALQADGWYLRSDVVWSKTNPMPESVTDRPTRAHEFIFLLSKGPRARYDHAAIREPFADARMGRDGSKKAREINRGGRTDGYTKPNGLDPSSNGGRSKRDVWTTAVAHYPRAHFATFPPDLIRPCVLSSSAEGEIVIDPFMGSGTVAQVAVEHGRRWIGCDADARSPEWTAERLASAQRRIGGC